MNPPEAMGHRRSSSQPVWIHGDDGKNTPASFTATASLTGYPEEALILPFYHPALATMKEDRQFHTLQSLINYYRDHEVPNKEGLTGVHLKHPISDRKRHRFYDKSSKSREPEVKKDTRKHPDVLPELVKNSRFPKKDYIEMGNAAGFPKRQDITSPRRHENDEFSSDRNDQRPELEKINTRSHGSRSYADTRNNTSRNSFTSQGSLPTLPMKAKGASQSVRTRRAESEEDRNHGYEKLLAGSGRRPQMFEPNEDRVQLPPKRVTHYSYARSPYKEMAADLVDSLRQIEGENANKCSCGIYHDEAELPRGWSFHRSTEPDSHNRVLFCSPEGELTWNLPIEVALELSTEQQDLIRELICSPPKNSGCHCFFEDNTYSMFREGTVGSRQSTPNTDKLVDPYLELIGDELDGEETIKK